MGRVICFVILIGLCWWAAPAYGELCRVYGEQQICLVSLKRSAKYYWEYRAVLRINGKKFRYKSLIASTTSTWQMIDESLFVA